MELAAAELATAPTGIEEPWGAVVAKEADGPGSGPATSHIKDYLGTESSINNVIPKEYIYNCKN